MRKKITRQYETSFVSLGDIYSLRLKKKKLILDLNLTNLGLVFFLTEGVYIITKSKILKCTTIYSEKPNRTVVLVGI